jgi:ADP-ribose pyrophosphatase YjhB (NUDIX family)
MSINPKATKESVAIVISNDEGEFLVVKRSSDDSFGGFWGLPAASLRDSETQEDTVQRAAKDKLGVEVKILKTIGDRTEDKGEYLEHLTEYLVDIINGEVSLETRDPSVSRYAEFKYSNDPTILVPAAKHGSICSRIFLTDKDITWL